jgi:hypothetical protein
MATEFDYFPPSPTLTNPDMILPSGAANSTPTRPARGFSPAQVSSISNITAALHAEPAPVMGMVAQLSARKPPMGQYLRPTSPADPDTMDELDLTPKKPQSVQSLKEAFNNGRNALASSPTINTTLVFNPTTTITSRTRRMSSNSTASSSIHSEDLERLRPKVSRVDTDGSVAEEEMDRKLDHFRKKFNSPKQIHNDDETETEGESDQEEWPTQRKGEPSEDYLSRRAEVILANAKKKLNVGSLPCNRRKLTCHSVWKATSKAHDIRSRTIILPHDTRLWVHDTEC